MKKIYLGIGMLICILLSGNAQFRKGYDITYNAVGGLLRVDHDWDETFVGTNVLTNEGADPVGGLKSMVKTGAGSIMQGVLNLDNGSPIDVDFLTYPYLTVRIRISHPTPVVMGFSLSNGINKTIQATVQGNNVWNTIRLDYSQFKIASYNNNFIKISFVSGETTFPYNIDIDWERIGNLGDPDSTKKISMTDVTTPVVVEKNAGQQTINLTGISNGTDVSKLSLSLISSKASIFEGTPVFSAIQPDGTATLTFTPKTEVIGSSNEQVLLKYNDGDSIIKYKSIWFDVTIISDPKMTIGTTVNAQMNQPKVNIKITAATNSIGGSSKLGIVATPTNTALITNLKVDGDTIKSDGTATLSFIPGLDTCGTDIISVVLTDLATSRTAEYEVTVNVTDPSNQCVPGGAIHKTASPVNVYPNPADDEITIGLPDADGYQVFVSDITGRIIASVSIPAGQTEYKMDISNQPSGLYFISASNEKSKLMQKLIIR